MKLLLELLKKILSRLSNSYTKEETDGALSLKIGVEEFDDGLAESSDLRASGDSALIQKLEANKANDDALANVVKWKTYAIAMQKMVDESLAMQIAEEFEKATVKYLNDPTATEEWVSAKNEDGSYSTTSPYREHPSSTPIIDFNVVKLKGYYTEQSDCYGIFHRDTNVPVFLPSVTEADQVFLYTNFSSVIALPSLNRSQQLFQGGLANPAVFCGNAVSLMYLYRFLTKFNRPFSFPVAENCSYLLQGATSFDQPVSLPSATNCIYLLFGADSFNQPLDLPEAVSCNCLLENADSFNQPLSLPKAQQVAYALSWARSFNQPVSFPVAYNWRGVFSRAFAFNQAVNMSSCSDALNAFHSSAMSADNISATLDSLPTWTDSSSHVITFTGCPGIASTATVETFTVTDEDGTEYSMENCPTFDTDDENQTLRKAFVLATIKKGWTVEL